MKSVEKRNTDALAPVLMSIIGLSLSGMMYAHLLDERHLHPLAAARSLAIVPWLALLCVGIAVGMLKFRARATSISLGGMAIILVVTVTLMLGRHLPTDRLLVSMSSGIWMPWLGILTYVRQRPDSDVVGSARSPRGDKG